MKDIKYKYRKKEVLNNILTKYLSFKEINKIIQVQKIEKTRFNKKKLNIIFTILVYIKKTILFIQKRDFLGKFKILYKVNLY